MPADMALLAPFLVGLVVLALAVAPELAEGRRPGPMRLAQWTLLIGGLFATTATIAYGSVSPPRRAIRNANPAVSAMQTAVSGKTARSPSKPNAPPTTTASRCDAGV